MGASILARLKYPLQGTILSAIVLLVLLTWLGDVAGLFGIFLLLVVGSAYVQFSYILFRASAMGRTRAPVLGPDEFSPVNSPTPWYALLITVLVVGLFNLLRSWFGAPADLLFLVCVIVVAPASLTLLVLNGSFLQALSPVHIGRMIVAMGPTYAYLPLVVFCLWGIGAALAVYAPWWLRDLAWLYLWFLALHVLGRIVYEQRDRLGFVPTNDQTLRAYQDEAYEKKGRNDMLDVAFQESRTDSARALALINEWFVGDNDTLAAREWAWARTREWPNATVALRLAQDVVARQLARGDATAALATTDWGIGTNERFRPAGADATMQLARAAQQHQRPRIVTALLSDFSERFPDDGRGDSAALLCARTALEKTNQIELARTALERLDGNERLRGDPRVATLRAMLEQH